jgi:Icc-related predicted phosphoesterase
MANPTMRVVLASDVHLEFGACDITNEHDADVLILAGDICVERDIDRPDGGNVLMPSKKSLTIREFFHNVASRFPHVVMIMGNHEHYHGDFAKTQTRIQAWLDREGLTNIHLLEKSTWTYRDYLFIGGTLWTDFNRADPVTLNHAKFAMSDFRVTKNSGVPFYKFIPEHALADHREMKQHIQDVIDARREQGDRSSRVVVVGHHCPSLQSIHERYRGDHHMNGCFASAMDDFILDRPEICLWVHGHTHEDFDYNIGSTRVVCNPRGYDGHEARVGTWQPKLIELE